MDWQGIWTYSILTSLNTSGAKPQFDRKPNLLFLSALLDIHIKGYILLHKQRKLQDIRPMGLAQTGQRDPCKAPPLL